MRGIDAYEAYLLPNGSRNPGSDPSNGVYVSDSLYYDATTGQEIATDGNVHVYQNFAEQATNFGYTAPQDFTTIVGDDEWDSGLGTVPQNIKLQLRDATDGFQEQWEFISNNNAFDYYVEKYSYIDDGVNPDAQAYTDVYGVDGAGEEFNGFHQHTSSVSQISRNGVDALSNAYDSEFIVKNDLTQIERNGIDANANAYTSYHRHSEGVTQTTRTGVDALGNDVTIFYLLDNDDGRSGMTRDEDDGVESLSQDFAFYGSNSGFGRRVSRFLHQSPGLLLNRLFMDDDSIELRRDKLVVGDGATKHELLATGHEFTDSVLFKNTGSEGLASYSIDPTTTTGWGARSIPDRAYVDTVKGTVRTESTSITAANGDIVLMTTGASDKTVTLPAAATNTDATINIKKVDSGAGNVIIDGNASETIDGNTTETITSQWTNVTVKCDGSNWFII